MTGKPPLIYLNNAATSWPKPAAVMDAVREFLSLPVFGSGRTTGSQGEDYVLSAREAVSRILGAGQPENVAFTLNATDSLNTLIQGFMTGKRQGGHVLTSALDHNSVLRPLTEYEQQRRIRLTILPFSDGYVDPDAIASAIGPETRLMVMTHGSNVLGSVQDIRTIGEILHDHGVYFIVDGAQTAGHIPVNLADLPVDAYVFTGHKGLLGLQGTGGFYVKDPESIAPVRFGGTGTDSFSLLHPRGVPERFEAGTHNYPGLAGLVAGVKFIEEIGVAAIGEKAKKQASYLIDALGKEELITLYHDHPGLPIISFNIHGLQNDDAGFILSKRYGVIARTGLHCAPLVHEAIDGGVGCIRLSLSWFTTDEECRIAADAILEITGHADSSFSSA